MEMQLHDQMNDTVAGVLRGKNILLMRQIAEEINWPDTELLMKWFKVSNSPATSVLVAFSNLR